LSIYSENFNQKQQIMQNEPNFSKSQIFITASSTRNYNEKCKLDTWSKRTQTKPILPAMAGKIALSAVEGPVQGRTILSRAQSRDLLEHLPAPGGVFDFHVLNFAGTSRPWSVISLESDIIFY
jgi:hypothetical protein